MAQHLTSTPPTPPDRFVGVYDEYEHGPRDFGRLSAAIKRVSWGAIFAGAVVAMVVQLTLNLLGLGIGLQTFDPATDADSFRGFGMGQVIWTVISGLIALFAGGWVAGRLAGMPRKTDGTLHGIVTWGLTTLFTFYLLTSGVGRVISGVTGVVGQGLSLVGQGVEAVAPYVGSAIESQVGDVDLSTIRQEAYTLLRQTGNPALQPEALEQRAEDVRADARQAAESAAQTPADARAELDAALNRTFNEIGQVASEADRQDLINVLVARTDLSREEARQTVTQWENTLQQARRQVGQTLDTLGTRAVETAERATDALGTAALIGFFTLLLGAGAAGFGGALGAPDDLPVDATRRPDVTPTT